MGERWKCSRLTFAHEHEGNELGIAQVNDLCGKHSALVMRQTPLTLVQRSWIHGGREVVVRKRK